MTKPASAGAAPLQQLCSLADPCTVTQLLPLVGRRLLIARPLFPDIVAEGGDDPASEMQSDWIDDQLFRCLPPQFELDSLDDGRFSTVTDAWAEGLDTVVFDDGTSDEEHALKLVDPFFKLARERCLPVFEDENGNADVEHYKRPFARMIAEWRDVVFTRLDDPEHHWGRLSRKGLAAL